MTHSVHQLGSRKPAAIREYARRNPHKTLPQIAAWFEAKESVVLTALGLIPAISQAPDESTPEPEAKPRYIPPPMHEEVKGMKLNPHDEARRWLVRYYRDNGLSPRLYERHGMDYLDGQPVRSVHQLMRAVNEERVRAGLAQIDYCSDWRI